MSYQYRRIRALHSDSTVLPVPGRGACEIEKFVVCEWDNVINTSYVVLTEE